MLKEIIICIIIVVSIVCGDFLTQNYTKQSITEISNSLSVLRDEIKQNKDKEEIKEKMKQVKSKWEDSHNKLAYYIEHNELEKVETELTGVESNIDVSEYEESINNLDKSVFLLKHIEDRYAFNLENIF